MTDHRFVQPMIQVQLLTTRTWTFCTQGVDLGPAHYMDIVDPAYYVCVIQCISSRCFVPTEFPGITAMQSQDPACLVCCRRCLLCLHIASSCPCLFHRCLPLTTVSGPWTSPTLLNMLVSCQVSKTKQNNYSA